MAVDPIFLSRANLLKAVRMSTATDTQTLAVVDSCMQDVRIGIYKALTISRVTEILTYSDVDNPSTEEELIRTSGRIAEINWVMYRLVTVLPVLFVENQYTVQEDFNEEPLTRDATALEKFKDGLMKIVWSNLNAMKVPEEVGDGTTMSASIGREDSDGDADPYLIDEKFIGLYRGQI